MPWIEIRGINRTEASILKDKIFEAMKAIDDDLPAKVAIEMLDSHCVNNKGEIEPHLRICSCDTQYNEKLVKILRQFNLPISILKLSEYISAEE